MQTITITYTLKFRLSFAHHYKWTAKGKCFNMKTGRQLKQVYNSGSIGYNVNGKFYSLTYLRKRLEKIPKTKAPF